MSTYDDIIEQNKRSLTQAQIAALAQAAQQYNAQNAGNRAGALASARQQYDTGYRGLQNMGLAGANGAQPTSGEVPRLKTEIQTPFDQYNQRLKSVERQRVAALSGNMVYQNQLAAEEARRRALAEEEARRQAAARETDQARFQRAQAAANAINRNRTFGKVTAADLSVPSRKEYEASTTPPEVQAFNQASAKAANAVAGVANTFPSVMVRAAAAMVGLQDPYSAINTAQQNEQLGAVKETYQKAEATLRGMDQTRKYGGTVDEKQYQATKRTRDEAKAVYDAEKSRREADNYRREAEKIQQQDPEYYDAIVTANNAKATPESRKSASRVIAARSVNDIVQGMGFTKTMTDKEYDDAKKVIPDVRMQLNIIDSTRNRQANGGTGGDDVIGEALAELKKMGYSEDSARELVKKFETDRNYNREYTYLIDAYTALQEHYGDKPEQGVNKNEKDYTYRMVNGLDTGTFTGTMGDALMSMWRDDKKIIGKDTTKYMTDEQRDAYNAIYEKDGIKAANEYIKDILPLIETQRAAEDQKWLEEMASKDRGGLSWLYANTQNPAWLLARATNLIGSIPAMAEKLAVNARNLAAGATGELKKYSPDSSISRISNWSDIIQAQQSKNILEHYESKNQPGIGKFVNFMYNTGTSMADSMIAMGVSGAMGSWATDALFFSSAGNQAYKDAIERGGTQEQAMGVAFASGLAEALFEHLSLEKLTQTLQFKGKTLTRAVKDMLTQAGVEGSEELFTELSNVLTDFAIMKDKSEMQQAINSGELGRFLWDRLSSATLGGLASGFLFGVAGFGGAAIDALADSKTKNALGTRVRENGDVQQVRNTAILLGGEAAQQAEKVQKRETNANVGEMTATVVQQVQEFGEKLDQDQQVAFARIADGAQMTAEEAADVYELLGKETVEKMNYDGTSAEAFQRSYNDRVQKNGVVSKEETRAKLEAERFEQRRQEAANKVWANPEQGLSLTTEQGTTLRPMPKNMTAISLAEQQRTNFQTRSTATSGNATYAISGMQLREGLTNEQAYNEIMNGLTREAQKKAQVYEKLAQALGMKMVIHDVMVGTNGFIDEKGQMHVVLSGRQSVLRVTAHELTHFMKENASKGYSSLRGHLIAEVGQKKFDQLVQRKARQYGLDLNTEKGRTIADDEACAELCERMLSNPDSIQKFADKDVRAAKTLKEHLLSVLNAIKAAFKQAENLNFGDSWSDLVKSQETLEEWIQTAQEAIANSEARMKTNEGQIAKVAGVTSVDEQSMLDEIHEIEEAKTDTKEVKEAPASSSLAAAAVRRQIEALKRAGDTAKAEELTQKLEQWEATQAKIDDAIAEHSVDVIEYDMNGYMQDLVDAGVMSSSEISDLFDTMNKAITLVKAHRAILDFGAELSTEEEILAAKKGRAYLPYKQNADPHYKLALDFSTLCRKRVLLQTIQERLQAKMGRALTQEETVAIRIELQKLQKEGKKVEVACALCYVEAARLKSPKVINKFLNNTEAEMRNYFAQKNPASKKVIDGLQQQWKVDHDYAPYATKKQMSSEDVKAFNEFSRTQREQLESGHLGERETIDRAVRLANDEHVMIGGIEFPGRETFLSASWLTKLKSVEPDIFNAFTDKVRSATRSKAQETDTFYSRGDIDMVTESILNYANAESGFRHQSWSDFVPTHLLDTMAAVIEMSTKGAKMHAYTKVPAMVKLLGKTGMALNMSLIPSGDFGIDANGNLSFDSVEGMPWETMMELRDMFPDTAGNIAIGINDEQIQKMLASKDIDYVIPYHASGMNKGMRAYLDIRAWSEFTSSQNEKSNHRGKKGAAPALEEWFDADAAAKAEDGYAFMRASSEKYLQLCAERNLIPKFSQYLTNNGDGSYSLKEGYEDYWKMLIDRKMVNQKTGQVIIQQPVKPTFDEATVLGILEDRLNDPAIQDAAEAADIVTEKFSGWEAGKNNASPEAIKAAKDLRDRTAMVTAQKTAEETGLRHDLDTELLEEVQEPAEDIIARYSLDTETKRGKTSAKKVAAQENKETEYKPAGKEPRVRDVKVPEVAKNGKRVSDFTKSLLESNKLTDDMVAELAPKVDSGEWGSYDRLTNPDAMGRAKDYIAKKQFVEAQQDFHAMAESGRYNVHSRALGLQLLSEASKRGDKQAILSIGADLRKMTTDAGQSVQIMSVLKDLGGVGAGWYMQKEIDRLNSQYADQIASGELDEFTVSEELMDNLMNASTQAEIEAAEDAIARELALQIPLTTKSKIVNWRYLSMLANPTTHFRNITGNVFMAGLNAAKDVVATGIERVGVKDKSQRAHALLNSKDRAMWHDIAARSFSEQERNLKGGGKNGFSMSIRQYMRSFENKFLDTIARGVDNGTIVENEGLKGLIKNIKNNGIMGMLEVEDLWFLRPAYQNAFMQYMKAQEYTVQDGKVGKVKNGKFAEISSAEMSKAVDWASEQAWKATFRDASTVASLLNNASQKLGPVGHVLIEGLMPFKKTPINIAKRGIEYSPAGIVMGTVQMMRDVKNGKMTAAQAIDNLSSGVVGTSLMVIGMAMAKYGLLRAGGEDKKKQETYLQDTGDQTYSLKLGKVSLGISALAPAAIPLLMGAALYDALDKSGEGVDLSSIAETIAGTLDPFMEMSVVSSLNSALKNYNNNGIGGALGNTIMTTLESYGAQFLPTFTGKVGQFIDPTMRTTKSSATSPVGSGLDYYGRSLAKKVPGLEATLEPDVNVWGRKTQKTSFADWALDFANKFILPMNVRISNRDAVDDELIRLVESTGNVNILPSDGQKEFTVKGESYPMTAKQYTDYSIDRGQASYAAIKEVMNSKAYQNASDTEKADMIENALKAAQKQVDNMWKERLGAIETATAKEETVKTMKGDYSDPALYKVAAKYGQTAYDKAAKAKSQGVSPDAFTSLYDYYDTYSGDNRAADTRKAIMDSDLTAKQKELMDDLIVSASGKNPDYSSSAWFDLSMINKQTYEKAKTGEKLGVSPETYLAAYNKDKEIDAAKLGKEKKSTVVKYVESLHLSAAAEDYLLANIFGYTTR